MRCRNCGSPRLLLRLPTAVFIPIDDDPRHARIDNIPERVLGFQAKSNVNYKDKVIYCPNCSSFFRMEDLFRPEDKVVRISRSSDDDTDDFMEANEEDPDIYK